MRIAPLQRQQLDFLSGQLEKLEAMSCTADRTELQNLQERLNGWAAKIAVIGQVKAGKSTFLNAFLGQHDFLPSDVNPWTSVVTNIRINVPTDPETGAVFHFFDEKDWAEIMDGSGQIRKMAEELLPGFNTDILKQQSEELREKAQRRLGDHYKSMLGSKHEYPFLSADLLKRYVCAGPGSDDGLTRESLGRYAALTSDANVFMRIPEFAVPTIVTDTPGVNDPFLVRDEVTCRSLDNSDVFIVVLSAQQPLTDVDIGLIRILAQQDGKDVLIFVNRIDELDGYDTRYESVAEDVSERLKKAIPEIEFTILTGSAFMADAALRIDDEAEEVRANLDTPTLAAYLKKRYGDVPQDRAERLLLGSGLVDMKRTLSMVIDNGSGSRQIGQIINDIEAQVAAITFATKRERQSVEDEITQVRENKTQGFVASLAQEIVTVKEAQSDLDFLVAAANEKVEGLVEGSGTDLAKTLSEKVDSFIDSQRDRLYALVADDTLRPGRRGTFDVDLSPLHEKIEATLHAGFDIVRDRIDSLLASCMRDCGSILNENFDDTFELPSLDGLPFDTFSTTLSMSKKSLQTTFETEKSWTFWRAQKVDKEKTFETMRTLAIAELQAPIEKLMLACMKAQSDRAAAGIERIKVMQAMLEKALVERKERLKEDQALLEAAANDETARAQMLERLNGHVDTLNKRLHDLATLENSVVGAQITEAA